MRKKGSKKEVSKKPIRDYQDEKKLKEMYEKKKMTAGVTYSS